MKDLTKGSASGGKPGGGGKEAPSKGYAFVTFTEHQSALNALRKLNNNPEVLSYCQQLITSNKKSVDVTLCHGAFNFHFSWPKSPMAVMQYPCELLRVKLRPHRAHT